MADLSGGRDPAKILRWIINETATPNYNNDPNPNSTQQTASDAGTSTTNEDNIPITRLSEMSDAERQKWTNIILGQTPDILNNRTSLQNAIQRLQQIKHTLTAASAKQTDDSNDNDNDNDNEDESKQQEPAQEANGEIKCCLSIIHNLLDKNEAVLAKLHGVPLLFELMQSSLDMDNEICLDCCTILQDATQNNPMMQNHLYSQNAVLLTLQTLQKCAKTNYRIRAKLWALIHVICRDHNPNFNIFLAHSGHHEISRALRIEQSNINDDLLKEILRVSRLIHYMLSLWSDGNEKVFEILDLLKSVNWTIYSLHSYVIRLVTVNPNNHKQLNPSLIANRLQRAQLILDILMELVGGIRMFMKRNDKCKRFVIANKNNKDITQKLKSLQQDLGDYCKQHRPKLKLEEKRPNGQPYKFKYYTIFNENDDGKEKQPQQAQAAQNENDDEDEDSHHEYIYFAMKDIWNTIASILRHVKRYEDHCEQQRKLREIWKRTTKKGQQFAKREAMRKQHKGSASASSSTPSSSPPPNPYQLVLYRKQNENDEDKKEHSQQKRHSHKKHHSGKHKKRRK